MGKKLLRGTLLALFAHQIVLRFVRRRWPTPAPALIGPVLAGPIRQLAQPPETVVMRSGVSAGDRVLEVGCGSGAFTFRTARAAGPEGLVVALDMQSGMLRQLVARLSRRQDAGHARAPIAPLRANAHRLPLADGCIDVVTMITVLSEIPHPERALSGVARVLRPGGLLAITEFLPDPDYVTRRETLALVRANGFVVESVKGSIWNYTVRCRVADINTTA